MNKLLMAFAAAGVLAFTAGCEWTAGSGVSTWADNTVAVDFSGVYVAQGSYVVTEPGSAVSNSVTGERLTSGSGGTSYAGTLAHPPIPGTLVVRAGDTVLFDNGSGATHADFAAEYEAGFKYAAVNDKYFQVIYVDAAGKIRGTGNVAIATTIA